MRWPNARSAFPLRLATVVLAAACLMGPGCGKPAGLQSHAGGSARFEVFFDQSYAQVYAPFDTSFTGFSELALLIREQGGVVSLNSQPLHRLLPHVRTRRTVLVLGVAMFQRYAPADLAAIQAFLRRGGAVLVPAGRRGSQPASPPSRSWNSRSVPSSRPRTRRRSRATQ